MTNWGGAYDPSTGIFSTPYNGLYSISFTLMVHPNNDVRLEAVKNEERIVMVYTASKITLQSSKDYTSYSKQRGPNLDSKLVH